MKKDVKTVINIGQLSALSKEVGQLEQQGDVAILIEENVVEMSHLAHKFIKFSQPAYCNLIIDTHDNLVHRFISWNIPVFLKYDEMILKAGKGSMYYKCSPVPKYLTEYL